jgi:replicative superfamily II helicase
MAFSKYKPESEVYCKRCFPKFLVIGDRQTGVAVNKRKNGKYWQQIGERMMDIPGGTPSPTEQEQSTPAESLDAREDEEAKDEDVEEVLETTVSYSRKHDIAGEVVDEASFTPPELDAGMGDIIQGSIRIMSDESMAALDVDGAGLMAGIASVAPAITDAIVQYKEDQRFWDRPDLQGTAVVDAPVVMDHGIYDPERCEAAKASPLYQYTELSMGGYTPNPSQANALELLEKTNKNLIVALPTGTGKTMIAEAAIADSFLRSRETRMGDSARAVYLCPSRALALQISKDMSDPSHPFAQQGWKISLERGNGVNEDPFSSSPEEQAEAEEKPSPRNEEKWMNRLVTPEKARVIISTPERLLTMMMRRGQGSWMDNVTSMIFDEGHLIGDDSRGAKFEGQQMQLYRSHYPRIRRLAGDAARIVFMSATMENALELASWQKMMTREEADWSVVWGTWRPVNIDTEFRSFADDEDLENKVTAEITAHSNTARTANDELTVRPTLVFCPVKRRAWGLQKKAQSSTWMCTKCRQPQEATAFWESSGTAKSPADMDPPPTCPLIYNGQICGGQLIKWKPDFHHAGESASTQSGMVDRFNGGQQKALYATSTLSAGVNTAAMSVMIAGATRSGQDVSTAELGQEAGRCGRQSFATQFPGQNGRVIYFLERDREIYHRRRIVGGAFMESRMVDVSRVDDNLLRAILMGSVTDAASAGQFAANTFSYFQRSVDAVDPGNVRRGLEAVSKSYGPENDRVMWYPQDEKQGKCPHPEVAASGGKPCGPDVGFRLQDLWLPGVDGDGGRPSHGGGGATRRSGEVEVEDDCRE